MKGSFGFAYLLIPLLLFGGNWVCRMLDLWEIRRINKRSKRKESAQCSK